MYRQNKLLEQHIIKIKPINYYLLIRRESIKYLNYILINKLLDQIKIWINAPINNNLKDQIKFQIDTKNCWLTTLQDIQLNYVYFINNTDNTNECNAYKTTKNFIFIGITIES